MGPFVYLKVLRKLIFFRPDTLKFFRRDPLIFFWNRKQLVPFPPPEAFKPKSAADPNQDRVAVPALMDMGGKAVASLALGEGHSSALTTGVPLNCPLTFLCCKK
jgi:hypothetical protein